MIIKNYCENLPKAPDDFIKNLWFNIPPSLRPKTPVFVVCESLFCGFMRMSLDCGFPFDGTKDEEMFNDWKENEVWAWATRRFDGKFFVFLGLEERLENGRDAFCQGIEFAIYHELGHIYHWSGLGKYGINRVEENQGEFFANFYATIMLSHYRKQGKFNEYFEKYPKEMIDFLDCTKNVDISTRNGISKTKRLLASVDEDYEKGL